MEDHNANHAQAAVDQLLARERLDLFGSWFVRRNWVDRLYLAKSVMLWLCIALLYQRRLSFKSFPLARNLPLMRGNNGMCRFGRNARLFGRLEIICEDQTSPGLLDVGDDFYAESNVTLAPRGGAIVIGDHCSVGSGTLLQATKGSEITVGSHTMIAGMVTIIAANHPMDNLTAPMRWQPEHGVGINIGPDVWIASHAVITDGVSIGKGAVIAAGAVVTRDVASYAVVAGVPARKIRSRQHATPNASPSANGLKQEPAAS